MLRHYEPAVKCLQAELNARAIRLSFRTSIEIIFPLEGRIDGGLSNRRCACVTEKDLLIYKFNIAR